MTPVRILVPYARLIGADMVDGKEQDGVERSYEPPRLRKLGTVAELTFGVSGAHIDGALAAGSL